jgi:hypothetical protein
MLVKLAWHSKTHATRHSALPAVIGASFDQVPLERGEASQDRHQQLALRRRGIAPGAATVPDIAIRGSRQQF